MEDWRRKINTDCLAKEFPLVRQRFFNENLFFVEEISRTKPKLNIRQTLLSSVLNCSIALGVFVMLFYFFPQGLMSIFPGITENLIKAEALKYNQSVDNENELNEQIILTNLPDQAEGSASSSNKKIKPKYDLNFPIGQWLEISTVGIKSELLTTVDLNNKKEVNKILDKGIYVYPDNMEYGNPDKMTILAGHHYNMWTSEKQNNQSFQKLNEVKVGDAVTITDNQKQWTYKIYKITQGSAIEDQTADLVMYTCVFWWNSDLRLFVYANLEMTTDTNY